MLNATSSYIRKINEWGLSGCWQVCRWGFTYLASLGCKSPFSFFLSLIVENQEQTTKQTKEKKSWCGWPGEAAELIIKPKAIHSFRMMITSEHIVIHRHICTNKRNSPGESKGGKTFPLERRNLERKKKKKKKKLFHAPPTTVVLHICIVGVTYTSTIP